MYNSKEQTLPRNAMHQSLRCLVDVEVIQGCHNSVLRQNDIKIVHGSWVCLGARQDSI